MKIVVLAGGTSTERSVSITSGTMVCKALREKNHQAVLVDVFCGIDVKGNLEDVFAEEAYDIDKAAEYMHSFDAGLNEMIASRRRFFGPKRTGALRGSGCCFPCPAWRKRRGRKGTGYVRSARHSVYRNGLFKQRPRNGQIHHKTVLPCTPCADPERRDPEKRPGERAVCPALAWSFRLS